MPDFLSVDARDVFYVVGGAAFFGLTFLPILQQSKFVSVPALYVLVGALIALSPFALPFLDPRDGGLELTVIEHASELIVIVSLAGAGLAVDRPMGLHAWGATWRLLSIAMPLTILALIFLGLGLIGLPIATAILLAACLAPTDPVLARSVQVGSPGSGEEHEVEVALTAEAGLNDGLAFPFVYLAIGFAALGAEATIGRYAETELLHWIGFDLVYRVLAGILVGIAVGWSLSRIVYSPVGDAEQEENNSGLTVMGATFLAYGLTELLSGYGFLAVFVSARAARHYARVHHKDGYEEQPHHYADQTEGLLMALLLLWFGALLATDTLSAARWQEWVFAGLLVFAIRPAAGMIALIGHRTRPIERGVTAFFGIRGMGSIFYLAYAQNHEAFPGIDVAWRVAALAILISVVVHGATAALVMQETKERTMKPADRKRGEPLEAQSARASSSA
ncbi:cation:proton antiporter [Parvularcula dongshanensis]|uniref:NhaP-type Na+/H+ or K+/H+ antiporter n=1 Tax=Parvularcula dongshanensis TaxID=1173995 RepID=A0A840I2N9_9PROT|nr:NhaP-type Na+/H+ or K+/H+ antiporter [Parvularcula dongshanensis]